VDFRKNDWEKKMKLFEDFPSSYVVDVEPDWPERGEEVVPFLAYDKLNMHTGKFRDIRFYPEKGSSWIGQFETGQIVEYEDSVFTVPNPSQACVISSGAGYWVDVEQRCAARIECIPITQAIVSVKHSLIIIATFRDLYAYSSPKASWSLLGLATDRLRINRIDQDILTAEGFEGGDMIEMHISILTGQLM
jgi:hypothetical protein